MNILFSLITLDIGGVEVVSAVLANKFADEGHHVTIFAFSKGEKRTIDILSPSVKQVVGYGFCASKENISLLRTILLEENIQVVINQWGLPLVPIRVINLARKGLNVTTITVFHNDPLQNGRIQGVKTSIENTNNIMKKAMLKPKGFAYRCVTGYAMRYNYCHSDLFMVLSKSFVDHFEKFTIIRNPQKLIVQTNPVTINSDGFVFDPNRKEREIIYMGRLDYTQKRVNRIIDVWSLLERKYEKWCLTLVGDGEERKNLEKKVKELGLKRVSFEGFQSPRSYYERASLLLLTSEFEGFPLVLAECMSFGVVPVVYGSYSAVYDIIEDKKDGIIVPKADGIFNSLLMAERIGNLIDDDKGMKTMALNAIKKSKNYSIDKIYEQWMGVFSKINQNKL